MKSIFQLGIYRHRLYLKLMFRYIPEKWKLILEQYNYIAEKKQVSSRSILMLCDYFKTIRDQKVQLHQKVNKLWPNSPRPLVP